MSKKYPHLVGVNLSHSTYLILQEHAERRWGGMQVLLRNIVDGWANDKELGRLLKKQDEFTRKVGGNNVL